MSNPSVTPAPFVLPRIGLGSWVFGGGHDWGPLDTDAAQKAVLAALETSSFVDTAPVYGDGASEQFLGRVLSGRRSRVILASKCGLVKNGSWTDHDLRPSSIRAQLENSLTRLRTDYLDLYQIHYPDPKVPLQEAVGELSRLQEKGKIRAIGLCNVTAEQMETALQVAPIFSVQNEYSLLHPQGGKNVLDVCRARGISFIGYGGLSGGILSGKYHTPPNLRRADARNYFYKCYRGEAFEQAQAVAARVKQVAARLNSAPAAVALSWALHTPGVSCMLCGARNETQWRQNVSAAALVLPAREVVFLEGEK